MLLPVEEPGEVVIVWLEVPPPLLMVVCVLLWLLPGFDPVVGVVVVLPLTVWVPVEVVPPMVSTVVGSAVEVVEPTVFAIEGVPYALVVVIPGTGTPFA